MPHILVVDDEPDVLELLLHRLRRAGYEVSAAKDGQIGFAGVKDLKPDLVLLDWMMPGLTGIEVTERIRKDPSIAGTRILMLTARAQEADAQLALAAGVDDYIVKPFGSRDMLERIEKLLAR
jgi:two-component system, OmpR family, alkaline phosphatase synthesis response regulator PhoP